MDGPDARVRKTACMAWRRPILTLLLVLLAVSLSSPRRTEPTATTALPLVPPDTGAVLHATLPADRTVRAPEGRIVELRISSLEPDIARIDALGLHGPVGPGLDGPALRFVAEPIGSYAVRLDVGGTRIGTIDVVAAKPQ